MLNGIYPKTQSATRNPNKQRREDYIPHVPAQKKAISAGNRDAKTQMRGTH